MIKCVGKACSHLPEVAEEQGASAEASTMACLWPARRRQNSMARVVLIEHAVAVMCATWLGGMRSPPM